MTFQRRHPQAAVMKKVFSFLVEAIFWLQLFISPAAIGALAGIVLYIYQPQLAFLSILLGIAGVITGIWWAERVRRKYGTSRYASKIRSTPDCWPDEDPKND